MAKVIEIRELRLAIAEPEDAEPFSDRFLNDLIDDKGSVNAAAASIWGHKAAMAAGLVDISESGSSRKMGDLYKNALAMERVYLDKTDADAGVTSGRPVSRPIVRPSA